MSYGVSRLTRGLMAALVSCVSEVLGSSPTFYKDVGFLLDSNESISTGTLCK